MLKKVGFVTAAMAAGAFLAGGVAATGTPGGHDDYHGGHTGQLGLLEANAVRRERLAHAVDRITGRFGEGTVIPATLLSRGRRRRPWHSA